MIPNPSALKTRDEDPDSHASCAWDSIPFTFRFEQPLAGPFFIDGDSTSVCLMFIAEELL